MKPTLQTSVAAVKDPTENRFFRFKENAMKIVFLLAACVSAAAVLAICAFLFAGGIPAMREVGVIKLLTGNIWKPTEGIYGIFPMIIGSLYVTAGAILIGVPIAVFCAAYLACFCPPKIYKILKPMTELLAGIPSIVYGFFGLTVLVPLFQALTGTSGKGMLTASLLLGIMILPTVTGVAESALRAVPDAYEEGSLALGATKEQSVFFVRLPAAKSGVFAGVILGIGRAIGETMAVVMIAGNQAVLPESLTDGVRTLTANIVLEMAYADFGLHRGALIASAVVLFVFILLINLSFSLIRKKS